MTFKEVYDENFRFVWRSLRRLGVREGDRIPPGLAYLVHSALRAPSAVR